MATRVVEGKKPYTGGEAIDIDQNKVISLKLRDENNLIIYDSGDDEIYADLQLPDGITPTDAFPVGVTTGRVVVADGWDLAGTIICAKTTSGDNIKLLYADDGTLWIDNGTGTFKQIYFKADVDALITTLTTYINTELAKKQNGVASATAPSNPNEGDLWYDTTNDVMKMYDGTQRKNVGYDSNVKVFNIASSSDLTTAQTVYDWYKEGNIPIVIYNGGLYLFGGSASNRIQFNKIGPEIHNWTDVSGFPYSSIWLNKTGDTITGISALQTTKANSIKFLEVGRNYSSPYIPEYNGSPATKKYVDDSISGAIYSGSSAPATPTEGMLWYDTTNDVLKTYDGSNWNAVGSGNGDVVGPASSTDGHLAVFDGATGKLIKDGGAVPTEPTVVSDDTGVTYHITVSNSDPASGTASNIITLVP